MNWIEQKFGAKDQVLVDANQMALKAGYYYGETAEIFTENYEVEKAQLPAGKYRGVSGNEATALSIDGAELSGLICFWGLTRLRPASNICFLSAKASWGKDISS